MPHNNNTFQFQRATRKQVKHRICIYGPSGSGKTIGALALAKALAQNGRIAVIDTENGSAAYYADRYEFDVVELSPPYTTDRYCAAIDAAVRGGYDVLVIDSASHQWAGEGGILSRKEALDARGGNRFTNWGPFTAEHEKFKSTLINAPIHIIATLRARTEYAVSDDETGKARPRKVGLAPVQRDGFEYEFGITFELQMDHRAAASKDRTGLFRGELIDLLSPDVGAMLAEWAEQGAPNPASERATPEQEAQIRGLLEALRDANPERADAAADYVEKLRPLTRAAADGAIAKLERAIESERAASAPDTSTHEAPVGDDAAA